jgi:hypothetical protein
MERNVGSFGIGCLIYVFTLVYKCVRAFLFFIDRVRLDALKFYIHPSSVDT